MRTDNEFYESLHDRLAEKHGLTKQQIPHLRNMFIGFGMTKDEVIFHFLDKLDKPLTKEPRVRRAIIDAGKEYDPNNYRKHSRKYYMEMIIWLLKATPEDIADINIEPRRNKTARELIISILRGVEKATLADRPLNDKAFNRMATQILDAIRKERYI